MQGRPVVAMKDSDTAMLPAVATSTLIARCAEPPSRTLVVNSLTLTVLQHSVRVVTRVR
jgi:hypothetical protein